MGVTYDTMTFDVMLSKNVQNTFTVVKMIKMF